MEFKAHHANYSNKNVHIVFIEQHNRRVDNDFQLGHEA